jgi:hypothetical protein
MKHLHSLPLAAAVITFASLPALAQEPSASPSAMPHLATSTSMPMDCGKAPMKRHDHGAERGTGVTTPQPMAMPCGADSAASAPAGKAKKAPLHDHAKFHKNQ